MLRAAFLGQLTLLWIASVHAFYIWYPDYVCAQYHFASCPNSKRTIDARHKEAEPSVQKDAISFDLFKREPDNHEDPARRVARDASRLLKKYASLAATSTLKQGGQLERRATNTYSIEPAATPTETDSAAIDQDGSDTSYFIQANFGSAGTPILMLLDSGAGTTWVMGSDCQSAACAVHDAFGPANSQTFKSNPDTFSIEYGSGSVSGQLASDTLVVAGMKSTMTFGIANVTSSDFMYFPFDGILGLSMSTGGTGNFLQTLQNDKVLPSNIFSISLNRNGDGPNNGEITFGAADPSRYTGSLSYTTVNPSAGGDWAVPMDDMGYDGKSAGISGRIAYIDTGTSYVFGPPSDVAAIHKLIPGANSTDGVTYSIPCDTNVPITVTFSGVNYTISPADWVVNTGSSCTSNIYGHPVVENAWLLGDVFLRNVYAVFDWEKSRIGFAARPASSTTATVTSSAALATQTTGADNLPLGSPSGMDGQETVATTQGTAVAETETASPSSVIQASPTHMSSSGQLERSRYAPVACIVALAAMMAS